MIVVTRLAEKMADVGLSQSALARQIGVSQQAVSRLLTGEVRNSKHLHRIARELRTSPAFLAGETDDPAPDAPIISSPAPVLHVMLPVALPSENALARMFEGMLEVADLAAAPAELARELAEMLPTALSALKGPLTEVHLADRPARAAPAEALATADHGSR